MAFNAEAKADELEQLAHQRLNSDDTDHQLAHRLVDEWLSLDQAQQGAVAGKLMEKYDNSSLTRDPLPMSISENGNVVGINFRRSALDLGWKNENVIIQEVGGIVSEAVRKRRAYVVIDSSVVR